MSKIEIHNVQTNNVGTKKYIVGIALVFILELTSVTNIRVMVPDIIKTVSQEYIRFTSMAEKVVNALDRKRK